MPKKSTGNDPRTSDLGKEIQRLRIVAGHTQPALADLLGVKVATLRNWEYGRSMPDPLALCDYVRACGADPGDWADNLPQKGDVVSQLEERNSKTPLPGFSGVKLRIARMAAGRTQEELAALAGVSSNHVSRMERGDNAPSAETAANLARALGVEVSALTR